MILRVTLSCWLVILALPAFAQSAARLTTVDFGIYKDCPLIENESTRVVLCPQFGGRVLEYSLDGVNALWVSPYELTGDETGRWAGKASAGRFDIGPERIAPKRDESFRGPWTSVATGAMSVRLVGPEEDSTGVQLIRDFTLASESSQLLCRQTIKNISARTVQYCHWSRTFGNGAGIVLIPLEGFPRFKNRYVRFEGGGLNLAPVDDNIQIRDGFLEIIGPPSQPKLGMDSYAGWLAHQQRTGLLFIKQFPTYPRRHYCEGAGITISTWAPGSGHTVELEPIGPAETLQPGQQASYTEVWTLTKHPFPAEGEAFDLDQLREIHARLPPTDLEGPR